MDQSKIVTYTYHRGWAFVFCGAVICNAREYDSHTHMVMFGQALSKFPSFEVMTTYTGFNFSQSALF